MNAAVALTSLLIVLARIADVTLDTIRTVAIVQGRRMFAAILGFFQALIYVCAIAKVLLNMDKPAYALAYAVGFALGTYLGITIEQRLAFGHQLVTLVTRQGIELAKALRAAGHRLAEVKGHTRDGDLTILFVETPRRLAQKLVRNASAVDKNCFCMVNDVRVARSGSTVATAVSPRAVQVG
jgi:uncharacterized protein YebE (UPF0316 family)